MSQAFISYSRVDSAFVEHFIKRLQRAFPNLTIWYDRSPHGLIGGDNWWEEILNGIAASDIFIYILSNESINSLYCQAEFTEARRLQKRIITIQARDKTELTDDLDDIQFIDMKNGPDDPEGLTGLTAAVNKQLGLVRKKRPLWKPATPKPQKDPPPARSADAPDITTPALTKPTEEQEALRLAKSGLKWQIIGVVVAVIAIVVSVIPPLLDRISSGQPVSSVPTFDAVAEAQRIVQLTQTASAAPTITPTDNITATLEAILTSFVVGTEQNQTATSAVETAVFTGNQTATAQAQILIDVQNTQVAIAATDAQATSNAQATLAVPTNTPPPTPTHTPTLTETPQPTPTPTVDALGTANAQATIDENERLAVQNAQATVNADASATDAMQATIDAYTDTPRPQITLAPITYVSAEQSVNVRAQPDANSAIVGGLAPDEEAVLIGQNIDELWLNIRLQDGTSGWVRADLVQTRQVEARNPYEKVTKNSDWTPISQDFNGVTMMLVPAGCFMMGSEDENDDEKPIHEQCFDEPFWIDQTEVTQAQFTDFGGAKANENRFNGEQRPVESINWFEARDFCEKRGARLPTEREWEYAARGPDGLVYPWGNGYENNAVWNRGSSQGTADVGSIPSGASWVGALDMSGNVWEWTSSLYRDYPYEESDGWEDSANRTDERVLRGGSWYIGVTDSLRGADRNGSFPVLKLTYYGFRCARSS